MSLSTTCQKVRQILKNMESLAFDYTNVEDLLEFQAKLEKIHAEMKEKLPEKEGLILRPTLTSEKARRVKLKYKKLRSRATEYSSLASSRKHRRQQPRSKVGRKAMLTQAVSALVKL